MFECALRAHTRISAIQVSLIKAIDTMQAEEEAEVEEEEPQNAAEKDVEEVEEEGQGEGQDDGYNSDNAAVDTVPPAASMQLSESAVATEHDVCEEDVLGPCHLPGYQHVENLCSILLKLSHTLDRISFTQEERNSVIAAWNKLDLHDRNIQQFDRVYSSRWGYAYFGRTNGDPDEAATVQRLKFGKRHAAAHPVNPRKNRLVYCLLKMMWLETDTTSPQKRE
jgi:hypothetical protein